MVKNYNIYFTSRMVSNIGDSLQEIAILVMIARYTNSVMIAGIIAVANALVRVICSVFTINAKPKGGIKEYLSRLNVLYAVITILFFCAAKLNSEMPAIILIGYELLCSLVYTFYKIYQEMMVKTVCEKNEQISRIIAADNVISVMVSFVSSLLVVIFPVEVFLLFNAVSFLAAAFIIKFMKVNVQFSNGTRSRFDIVGNIKQFKNSYGKIYSFIILMCFISFFFSTYSIILQAAVKHFSLGEKHFGYTMGIFYFSSIIFSYLVGYIDNSKIKRSINIILGAGIVGLSSALLLEGVMFIIVVSVIYPLFGSGLNSLIQIYFQNNTKRDDIPILKAIYNIFCGFAIVLAGILAPVIINNTNILCFVFLMIMLNICSWFYVRAGIK